MKYSLKNNDLLNCTARAVLVASVAVMAIPGLALAQTVDLAGTVSTVKSNISNVPTLLGYFFYITGAAFIGMGLKRLKDHAENASSNPLGKCFGPLIAGSGCLAVPSMSNWLNSSLGVGTGAGLGVQTFSTLQ